MRQFKVTGQTQVFGIFGHPITHTFSPQMHFAAFEALDLQNVYLPFDVHPKQLKKAVESIIPLGIKGVNVTIPHKENVIPYLDQLTPEARATGAVNTIEITSDRLIGHNTDGLGFVKSLFEKNIDPCGMSVLIIGSGGAAKGIAISLLSAGVSEIVITARNPKKREALATRLRDYAPKSKISVFGFNTEGTPPIRSKQPLLLVNSTPLGMQPGDPLPFPPKYIDPDWVVADLIYRPNETPLLIAAKKVGAETISGLGMLLYQGAIAFEIWTKEKPPVKIMRKALLQALSGAKLT
ncbi:shikimate dehydrogenase [Nitrospira defluvii]|nr:shikimate dehydrogenase [Nitrospira defluvii]